QKRFKAFIAHCGIFDFDSMYGETEELFFINNDYGGPYWDKENATAMRSYANSPHKFVDRWDTPILIITGERDYRIPYTQSLEAFTAARVRGIPARLLEFQDEAHQVFKPQNSMVWNREFFGGSTSTSNRPNDIWESFTDLPNTKSLPFAAGFSVSNGLPKRGFHDEKSRVR
ncbi:prolyl oligopeptidase family protein, partial [human gut metagenome]